MMTALAARPKITPDDLLRLPDGDAYELIDGQLRNKAVSFQSSNLASVISYLLTAHVRPNKLGRVSGSDSSFRCFPDDPDKVRRPDVAYVSRARMSPELYLTPGHTPVCPELVVEVVSPTDLADEHDRKIQDWLAAGAMAVWSVHPAVHLVYVHRSDGTIRACGITETVTMEDILPGFLMSVADVFSDE